MSKKEYNNPEMRCSQFYQISCVIPKNCYNCAMDVRDHNIGEDKSYTREDIFIVSQAEFGRSYYHSPEQVVDEWKNTNLRFKTNELNRDYTKVGIGVVEGKGNFYVVVRWE